MVDPRMRHRARARALQFLFSLDFTGYDWEDALEPFWRMKPVRPSVERYADRLIKGVCREKDSLDAAITEALVNWSPDRVGRIEWNILRIALFEMRHREDVPPSVAINEAIEVAKTFGADDAPRFVNGVLDRLRRGISGDAGE